MYSFYSQAPLWAKQGDAPDTAKSAEPTYSHVEHSRVIEAVVFYRGVWQQGIFLQIDELPLNLMAEGWRRVELCCLWFGRRL